METKPTDNKPKKRIVYFIPEFPRLTETFIAREVEKLAGSGRIDIRVLSLKKASGVVSGHVEGLTSYRRLELKDLALSLSLIFKSWSRVKEAWLLLQSDTGRSLPQKVYFFFKALGYSRVFAQETPDHIHVHFLSDPSTLVMLVSVILNKPFSISAHAKDIFVESNMAREKGERAEFITVCNTKAYDKCLELVGNSAKAKIYKIYHGVEPFMFTTSEERMRGGARFNILTVARLVEKKGLRYLVEASRILKERGVDHEMHIIGPGPLYQDITDMINKNGLDDTVFIEGAGIGLPYKEIQDYFRKANAFVLPSIETGEGDADGVPNVIVEAVLSDLPVITTDAGSITDLIVHGETGILVPQKDSQALASAIERLILQPEQTAVILSKAKEKATAMFDLEKNVMELEHLLMVGRS